MKEGLVNQNIPPKKFEIPDFIFDLSLIDDYEGYDYDGYGKEVAKRSESCLKEAGSEEEWNKRLEAILDEMNEQTGGYERGLLTQKSFLIALLSQKTFPKQE